MKIFITFFLLILLSSFERPTSNTVTPSNILVIVADDLGTDMVGAYGNQAALCPSNSQSLTPNIDALAGLGRMFTRFYTEPVCSPTRACFLTGKNSFRTGVGTVLTPSNIGLGLGETTIMEHLKSFGYSTIVVGKWHLAGNGDGLRHPNQQGADQFLGTIKGVLTNGYSNWDRIVNGIQNTETSYATSKTVLDLFQNIGSLPQPWFIVVNFHAPHEPFHDPIVCGGSTCFCGQSNSSNTDRYRAMIESMDAHAGFIVSNLFNLTNGNLWTFFLGDNGTPGNVKISTCPRGAKASLYEGGINTPLIVHGPGIATGIEYSVVSITDLFNTICDVASVPYGLTATDSISFYNSLMFGTPPNRPFVYQDYFTPNGLPFNPIEHFRTVFDQRWKLVRYNPVIGSPSEEMYDLLVDPCESTDLLQNPLSPQAQIAYDSLVQELIRLGVN